MRGVFSYLAHRDTFIYIYILLECPRVSRSVSRAFYSFSLSGHLYKFFKVDSFVAGASKTQEDAL